MKKALQNAINVQIKNELYSAYLYLEMSNWCAAKRFTGAAKWMRLQVKEEYEHAIKMVDYLVSRKAKVTMLAIAKPTIKLNSLKSVFTKTLAHEKKVTALIHKLYKLATKLKDNHAKRFLKWYVDEQIEEEETAEGVLRLFGKMGLKRIDKKLARRKG